MTQITHLAFGGIVVAVPPLWQEFREPGVEVFTLARRDMDGGALQFSIGIYRAGQRPEMRPQLQELLEEFAAAKQLGPPLERAGSGRSGTHAWVGCSYRLKHEEGESLLRVWYVSDGPNTALVTYVTVWNMPGLTEELYEAEAIVRSLRFDQPGQLHEQPQQAA